MSFCSCLISVVPIEGHFLGGVQPPPPSTSGPWCKLHSTGSTHSDRSLSTTVAQSDTVSLSDNKPLLTKTHCLHTVTDVLFTVRSPAQTENKQQQQQPPWNMNRLVFIRERPVVLTPQRNSNNNNNNNSFAFLKHFSLNRISKCSLFFVLVKSEMKFLSKITFRSLMDPVLFLLLGSLYFFSPFFFVF